ncbi:MAG: T9SS type A sorting domain-containing protein [Bacteroidales bacterium]|nr:T9SS type A sorting domain-containing protein [Bacteroidales bacterium]MCF8455866.1 T9SS type A sorting domain-containing protein [Bacteroidales bacterium]
MAAYPDRLQVYVVYAVEAHPASPDPSPYSGNVWQTPAPDGSYYSQPKTYSERKYNVTHLLQTMTVNAPVLLDGPCNEWWMYYTNWPNNAVLLDSTGVIFSMHSEFDDFHPDGTPADIFCDIDSLLGYPTGCGGSGSNGNFTFTLDGSPQVIGAPGLTHSTKAKYANNSQGNVYMTITKLVNDMPQGWTSQLCTHQNCYDVFTDVAHVFLQPGDTGTFTMYFNTNSVADTGRVKIEFANDSVAQNKFTQNFRCITTTQAGIKDMNKTHIQIYPNPCTENCMIVFPSEIKGNQQLKIYDSQGKMLRTLNVSGQKNFLFNRMGLPSGLYYFVYEKDDEKVIEKLILD